MTKFNSFKTFGLSQNMLEVLENKGFFKPTPIQVRVIPLLMKGERDIIGQAQTGTGKTAAFGIPIIEKLKEGATSIQALVLTPTRELALQVSEELESLKGDKNIRILPLYGGQAIRNQLKALTFGADIVVGTPGRIIDHLKRGNIELDSISYLVLDEADEMLNMGFIEDVKEIFRNTNENKQMLLFSATMPTPILKLAKKHMRNHDYISVSQEDLIAEFTDQIWFELTEEQKFEALCRLIDINDGFYGLVFCNTKSDTIAISQKLGERGYAADALNGDLTQDQRENILKKFRNRRLNILVATDVAARGIDVVELTHVINYSLPQDAESYIHRIGRTGRAGKQGTAITFVTPTDSRRFESFIRTVGAEVELKKVPSVKDVINSRTKNFKENIAHIIKTGEYQDLLKLANELLENHHPSVVVAALLKYSFQDTLKEEHYPELDADSSKIDDGKVRLFVAIGNYEGIAPENIPNFLSNRSGISDLKIENIEVFSRFSFVTVPKKQADLLLERFADMHKRNRPFVELAMNNNVRENRKNKNMSRRA